MVAMLDNMMAAPYKTLFIILEILKFLNCSYFAKIMTRKPKIGNLTKVTELHPFLESKKWYLLFKGNLWLRDLFVKIINMIQVCLYILMRITTRHRMRTERMYGISGRRD